MKRREFIILTGAGAATTTLLAGCGHPEEKLIPAFIPDDDYVPGLDYWKATACRMCSAGCGIIVRTREHKANKIEGNPLHPVNRGALCARGQAGLQVHYNPDQIRGPKKRMGERGSGQFGDISWDEAIKTLADKLRELRSRQPGSIVLAAQRSDGVTGLVAEHFMAAVGSSRLAVNQYPGQQIEEASYHESYGGGSQPIFDIAGARYLLSFGARFLETWHSPVMYSLAYARFRQSGHGRGRFVQVEPRLSMTAANADAWLPAAAGTEGLVALGITQVIIHESLVPGATPPSFLQQPLDDFAPDKTAGQTGIPAERIVKVAREFAAARGLAIGGGAVLATSEATNNMRAINFLNILVGNLNKPGGVLASSEPRLDPLSKWRNSARAQWASLPQQLASETAPGAVLFYRANPLFTAPWLADTIKAVPFIASFSSFMDETTAFADLILPDNSNFESWDLGTSLSVGTSAATPTGLAPSANPDSSTASRNPEIADRAPTAPVPTLAVTLSRPVLSVENDTRQTAEVLIAVGKELGDDMGRSLPFSSAEEVVKAAAAELQKLPGSIPESTWQKVDSGSEQGGDSNGQFWSKFFEAGVWIGVAPTSSKAQVSTASGPPKPPAGQQVGAPQPDSQYPLTLLAYDHPALGYGAEANLPWLQELPEPMTTVMWGSWIEINPTTAAAHSIEDGDLVEIRSVSGSVRAPALIYPAIHPDMVAVPYGQGHTAYGMYAAGRGVNAAELCPVLQRSALQTETVRVSISKVSGDTRLIRFGTMLPERPEKTR
jgi:anaerobic selenocysteine-containing dehydrogenase